MLEINAGRRSVARRRHLLVVPQKCLDDSISVPLARADGWQGGRSALQLTPLLIPAPSAASETAGCAGGVVIGMPGLRPGNSQRLKGCGVHRTRPPYSTAPTDHHLRRQHDIAVLAALGLLDTEGSLARRSIIGAVRHRSSGRPAKVMSYERRSHNAAIPGGPVKDHPDHPGLVSLPFYQLSNGMLSLAWSATGNPSSRPGPPQKRRLIWSREARSIRANWHWRSNSRF